MLTLPWKRQGRGVDPSTDAHVMKKASLDVVRGDNNRRAKFYALTADGRRHLKLELDTWQRYTQAVSRILSATTGPGLRRA